MRPLRGARPGGFNALLADGSVRFLSDSVDLELFRALLTRGGGEVIRLDADAAFSSPAP